MTIVRSLRYLRSAVAFLLPDENKRRELEEICDFDVIDVPDKELVRARQTPKAARASFDDIVVGDN